MRVIPKGSKVHNKGVFIATTLIDMPEGHTPMSKDFKPEIAKGTKLDFLEFFYEGKMIYQHPDFIG